MSFRVITPAGWQPPRAPYAHAVLANGVLYVSGIVGQKLSGEISERIEEQIEIVLEMLTEIWLGKMTAKQFFKSHCGIAGCARKIAVRRPRWRKEKSEFLRDWK